MRRVKAAWVLAAALAWCGSARGETLAQVAAQIGANTFYSYGYTGTRTLIGEIDAGLAWTGHQALDGVNVIDQANPFGINQVEGHATQVAGTMAAEGIGTGGPGISYGSTVWSGGISTGDTGGGGFSITGNSLLYLLMAFGETGINDAGTVGGTGSRTVEVTNSSWGGGDDTGNTVINVIYDYLANSRGVTMVCAAGNAGQGEGKVGTPANGWNVIAVGATGGTEGSEQVTSWSSGGTSGSFNLTGTRTKPDLVAPGLDLEMPTYNTGDTDEFGAASGTSFASPVVAASAALIVDRGKDTGRSTDPRLVKALLMNSATKLAGWSQETGAHPTKLTVINETPVDPYQGAGRVNLTEAWREYNASSGMNGDSPGTVGNTGWSVGNVAQGTPEDYVLGGGLHAGDMVTATLIWFMDRTVSGFNYQSGNPFPGTTFRNDSFDDLDLYLYEADVNGAPTGEALAASISGWDVNNPDEAGLGLDSVEHLYFAVPEDGNYLLRVVWTQEIFDNVGDVNAEDYALVWTATPEPGTMVLVGMGLAVIMRRRRGSR